MPERSPLTGCPPGEDLTALAHGESLGERRSTLLRHVLACPDCRAQHAASERILLALRGLGAARASRAPADPAPARTRRLLWAWVPPAVAAAAVAVALLAPFERSETPATRTGPPAPTLARATPAGAPQQAEDVGALVAAQQADGRWAAEAGMGGRTGDEAATALVVLALLHPGAVALEQPPVARAAATGSRWLALRAPGLVRGASPADVRTRAVVAAALLRAQDLTRDPSLRTPARELFEVVARDAQSDVDHASRPWIEYALATAQAAGWAGAGRDRLTLAAAPRPVAPQPEHGPEVRAVVPGTVGGPVHRALETLKDEPTLMAWSRGAGSQGAGSQGAGSRASFSVAAPR